MATFGTFPPFAPGLPNDRLLFEPTPRSEGEENLLDGPERVLCHLRMGHLRVAFRAKYILGWAGRFGVMASKITDAQKAFVIKQSEEGTPVVEVCRKALVSEATYFNSSRRASMPAPKTHPAPIAISGHSAGVHTPSLTNRSRTS